jgi:hypothetical protein
MQEPQLRDNEEQEDDDRSARVQEILSSLPQAHWPQGNEITMNAERGTMNEDSSAFIVPRSSLHTGV